LWYCEFNKIDGCDNDQCTADTCDTTNGCNYVGITCEDNDDCTDDSCDANIFLLIVMIFIPLVIDFFV